MTFTVLTLFPEFFFSPLQTSILGRAIKAEKIKVNLINIRDFAKGPHKVTDDAPYGGGRGMVMKPEPIIRAIKKLKKDDPRAWIILLSPQGRPLRHDVVKELSTKIHLALICGHYEGVDERVKYFIDDECSVGDFVLTGGEAAALCLIDSTSRLVHDVIGSPQSAKEESFSEGVLEYPHYTRPPQHKGYKVPQILLSGNHKNIAKWRKHQALIRTLLLRPDLLFKAHLTKEDKTFLKNICSILLSLGQGHEDQ
jgi:tRNA (guanine37-N1)-methyltransferase